MKVSGKAQGWGEHLRDQEQKAEAFIKERCPLCHFVCRQLWGQLWGPREQYFLRKEKVSAGWLKAKGLTQERRTCPAQRNSVISHPVQSAAQFPAQRSHIHKHTHMDKHPQAPSKAGPQLAKKESPSQILHKPQPRHQQTHMRTHSHTHTHTLTQRYPDTHMPTLNHPNQAPGILPY